MQKNGVTVQDLSRQDSQENTGDQRKKNKKKDSSIFSDQRPGRRRIVSQRFDPLIIFLLLVTVVDVQGLYLTDGINGCSLEWARFLLFCSNQCALHCFKYALCIR